MERTSKVFLCVLWMMAKHLVEAAISYPDISMKGLRSESIGAELESFANDLYGQPFIYNASSSTSIDILYGSIKDTYSRNQSLLDCYPIHYLSDYQCNTICVFKPNKDSPENKDFYLRRYKVSYGGSMALYFLAPETNMPDLTATGITDWHVVSTLKNWMYFLYTELKTKDGKEITLLRYYVVKLEFRANKEFKSISSLTGIEIEGSFSLRPYFKAVLGPSDSLILFNTLNSSLPLTVNANQTANDQLLILKTSETEIWSGRIIPMNLTETNPSSPIRLLFDVTADDQRLLVVFPQISPTDPTVRNLVLSSYKMALFMNENTLQEVKLTQPGLPESLTFPTLQYKQVAVMEMSTPYTFSHFANVKRPNVSGDSMMLFLHLPRTTQRPKDSRTELYWLNVVTGDITIIGDRVISKPTDKADDIRVKNYFPASGNFNILHIGADGPEYIDNIILYGTNYAAADPRKKIGEVYYYRVALQDCWSSHLAVQYTYDFDNLNDRAWQWQLFCNHNGMASWFGPAGNSSTYSVIMNMSREAVTSSITLNATNLTALATTPSFDIAQRKITVQTLDSVFDSLNIKLKTNNTATRKNSYQILPFYFAEIKGANISIKAVDNNPEVEYMDYRKHQLVYPKTIKDFDLDEIFPISYGLIAAHDNKAIGLFQCTETVNFTTQKILMNCAQTATIDIPFVKITAVKDYFSKCSLVLIMARNSSMYPPRTDNQTVFITYNVDTNKFTQLGDLTDRQYYDVGCSKVGTDTTVFAAAWDYRTFTAVKTASWVNGVKDTTNAKTANIEQAKYINSAQFSLNDKITEFYYFIYFNINSLGILNRNAYDSGAFKAAENSTRYIPIGTNPMPHTCIFKNYYLTHLPPMGKDSWVFAYSIAMTKPIKDYYTVLKYDLSTFNLTSVVSIHCHQLSTVDSFTVFGKQILGGTTYSVFLTFVIDPAVDQRLFSIISKAEQITSITVTDNLADKVYITMKKRNEQATETWRIQFGTSQTMAYFKNVKTTGTLPQNVTFKYEASNNLKSQTFDFIVTFDKTAAIELTPKVNSTEYVKGKVMKLTPDLLSVLKGPILGVKVNATGAMITKQRITKLDTSITPLPVSRNKLVTPKVIGDFTFGIEALYVEYENTVYIYQDKKLLIKCEMINTQIPTTNLELLKISFNAKYNRLWIVYATAAPEGGLYSLPVSLTNDTTPAACFKTSAGLINHNYDPIKLNDKHKDIVTMLPYTSLDKDIAFVITVWQAITKKLDTYYCKHNDSKSLMECPSYDLQTEVKTSNSSGVYSITKYPRSCANAFKEGYSLLYTVCILSDTDTSIINQIVVASYYLNSVKELVANFSSAIIENTLIGDTKNYLSCTVLDNNTISCCIANNDGSKIRQITLHKTTPYLDNRYYFSAQLTMDYNSPNDYEMHSTDMSREYIMGVYYRKQGPNRQDFIDLAVFKHGHPEVFTIIEGGIVNNLAIYSIYSGFFGLNRQIIYFFDARNLTLQPYEIAELEITFEADNLTTLTSHLIFEPQGSSSTVNLSSVFIRNTSNASITSKKASTESSFLAKYWYVVVIGGVTLVAAALGVTYWVWRREQIKKQKGNDGDIIIDRLEDFIF